MKGRPAVMFRSTGFASPSEPQTRRAEAWEFKIARQVIDNPGL